MGTRRIAVLGTGFRPQAGREPPAPIAARVSAGFRAELHDLRLSVFPANPLEREDTALGYIDAALAAADDGCDGIYVNTVGDYGIETMRAMLDVPVVGAGEATMLAASRLGRRFAIVTVWPPMLDFIYERVLADNGLSARCTGIRHLSGDCDLASLANDSNFVTELRAAETRRVDEAIAACRAAVEDDGADAIVIGCTCMGPVAPRIIEALDFPVLDGMVTGYLATEYAVAAGLRANRAAFADHAIERADLERRVGTALAERGLAA